MVILLFFFFCVGLYTFSRGLKIFREIEILKGTPVLPIRNLPIGLVRIHGKASGDRLVSGPVSKTACHFYWVVIEAMSNRSWGSYATDADGPLFHLEDGSGKVSVDAHDAEYDLVQSAQRILGKDARSTTGSLESGTSAASLLAYIGGVHAPHPGELPLMLDSEGLPLGWFRLTEYLILPGQSYDIVGTCTDNRSPTDQHDHNLIKKGQKVPTFIITSKTAEEEESTFRRRAMGQMLGGAAISVLMLVIFLAKHGWLF
ncbi:MAG TPA: hypothetical protein VMQ56_08615 [Terracidiphilus sp.]|nr:hypothetical protein [Terracidiphilus sp.]